MHMAAEKGHTSTVEFLADKFRASVFDRTKDGSTLMHIAALNGHPETAMVNRKIRKMVDTSFSDPFQEGCPPTDAKQERCPRDPHGRFQGSGHETFQCFL